MQFVALLPHNVRIRPLYRLVRRKSNIMRAEEFHAENLVNLLREHKMATIVQLKQALGTEVDMTVFRKLKPLGYLSSYSHRGKYYTLADIPRFDEHGLWSIGGVGFSRSGTLLETAQSVVQNSERGYFADELRQLLHVEVKEALRSLVQQRHLAREKVAGRYWYCSARPNEKQQQRLTRRFDEHAPEDAILLPESVGDEVKAAVVLFFSLLDEKQRRLYAGLESLRRGHGGDRKIANLLGLSLDTVARGRRELLSGELESGRVRRAGGGRKAVKKNA